MNKMQKILIVTSRVPWPLDKGDKLRAYHQIKSLSEKAEIYLFCTNDSATINGAEQELKKYCKEILVVPLPKTRIIWNLFLAFFKKIPFQVAYFYNYEVQKSFDRFINNIKPNSIYCQLIRTSLLIRNHKEFKVLDYMDTFSKGMERRMKNASGIKKFIFGLEQKRLNFFEKEVFNWYNERIIISEQDKNLIPHSDRNKIIVIPNGVELDYFQPQDKNKDFDLLFNGNMNYPPNVEAAEYLCKEIIPVLKQKGYKLKVLISGTSPSDRVRALENESVKISGWVSDIRENYARSKILVAPMQSSIGLQNKLLEAMAMGVPCVTSKLANNALGADSGMEIFTADTPGEYANHIVNLLTDSVCYNKLSEAGHNFIKKNYSWESKNNELLNLLIRK